MEQLVLNVDGIKCEVCEASIQDKLKKLAGVETAVADAKNDTLEITFDPVKTNTQTLKQVITEHGLTIIS